MAYDDDFIVEETEKVCKVYDSDDFFTVAVQMMLAAAALLSLWFKRQSEKPRRKFRTWFLDIAKQGIGACYAHVCNMIIAAIIVDNTQGDDASLEDECAWYAIAYLVDTTLGLVLAIWFLKALDMLAHQNDWVSLKHSGVYEGVDGVLHFANQTVAWMVVLTLVKIVIYYFMVLFSGALAVAGALLFEPFQSNIRFELLFVMIFFPGVLNLIYFWIADSYLKAKKEHAGAHEDEDAEAEMTAKQEGLLTEEERRAQEEPGPTSWISMATFV